MRPEHFFTALGNSRTSARQPLSNLSQPLNGDHFQTRRRRSSSVFSDKDSAGSVASSARFGSKRQRTRIIPMKSSKSVSKKSKAMDYTNYAYNEAVSRLKLMLADSYATPKGGGGSSSAYLRNLNEDSTDNYSDNVSVIERPIYSDISKYLSPSQKSRISAYRSPKPKQFGTFSASKENLALPLPYQSSCATSVPLDYYTPHSRQPAPPTDSIHAPVEIMNFIEKQEDYIEQLEKESKYCRNELSNLLGKVKDVISENEQLTETTRSELAALSGVEKSLPNMTSLSSDSDEQRMHYTKKSSNTPRSKKESNVVAPRSPRYAAAPNIVYEARISELEAELMQANIDLKRLKTENEDLKRKLAHTDPLLAVVGPVSSGGSCDTHRKQIEHLQQDKSALEENIRQLQRLLDDAKSQQYNNSSKRYVNDLVQMERAQAELEVKHLREELDRQHERVRELQHEMARRISEERANAERRYNTQVDQLGGDLSNQWEQVAKLQLDLERERRYASDLKRDLANRNSQIDELKMELRSNRSTFLTDMAQASAEKQSLEQEITALRLQLDRAAREAKTEASRLNAEISSLRQRLDRGDADLLHSKREVLRLNDEIANLEKELAYGELKNEIRPTKKDLDQRISELQDKHAETVNELEDMIQSQKQLMDKLTSECKTLTGKLEDTTLKHNEECRSLRDTNQKLMERLKQLWVNYKQLYQQHTNGGRNIRYDSANDIATSSGEEHFTQHNTPSLVKPLSTTSRPLLAQPTVLYAPTVPMTTPSPLHIVTNPYSASPVSTQQISSPAAQRPSRLQLASVPCTTTLAANQATNLLLQLANISQTTTTTASTIPMTKTSKTTSAKARNGAPAILGMSPEAASAAVLTTTSKPTTITAKTTAKTTARIMEKTTAKTTERITAQVIAADLAALQKSQQIQTLPLPTANTTLTTAPMAATTNSNMTPAVMTPTMTSPPTTEVNTNTEAELPSTTQVEASKVDTTLALDRAADTVTTVPPTTSKQHISTTLQPQWQAVASNSSQQQQRRQQQTATPSFPQLQLQQQQHRHLRQRPSRPQSQASNRHLPVESPRTLLAAQQQKAVLNRERALALWGQQVSVALDQSAEENPICHNSLPRPQPKSSCLESDQLAATELELDFSISSPSLMRSEDSGSCTEVEDGEGAFDSISDMSVSTAPTAIRRMTTAAAADVNKTFDMGESGEINVAHASAANLK